MLDSGRSWVVQTQDKFPGRAPPLAEYDNRPDPGGTSLSVNPQPLGGLGQASLSLR